ncbi:MAG: amidohydrolase family protein [Chloroflexi bacterium]|nr:amidohydrolase family protein [Chloroflexota bacterium]
MIIDGHAHACGDFLTAEGILAAMDANGVDKLVLLPGEHGSAKNYRLLNLAKMFPTWEVAKLTNAMTRMVVRVSGAARHLDQGNQTVFNYCQSHPDKILQFYWVTLKSGFDLAKLDDCYRSWKFKGLKLHQCWDDFRIGAEAFASLVRFAKTYDLPIFIHLGNSTQAAALVEFAGKNPEVKFIVGHLFDIERFINARQPMPNVYFDISCPDLISDIRLQKALGFFGAQRFIMGSDTPYGQANLARNIRRVRALEISEHDKELILGTTLARMLNLVSANSW